MIRRAARALLLALTTAALVTAGLAAPAAASSSGGSGGPLTDRLGVPFSSSGYRSTYHIFASRLDWSRPVGLLVYTDGSGGLGLDTPYSDFLLDADGSDGLVAVARKHNLLLVTPEAPGPDCDDSDNCWYDVAHAPGKARWSSDLIARVKSQYDIDLDRVVIAGYSSGAQWATRFFLPKHGQAHSVDLAIAISYGGAPVGTPRFSPSYRASTVVSFDTGTADTDAYSTKPWGARGGYSWYTRHGFVTDATWPSKVGHYRWGQFARIVDREISQHLGRAPALPPEPPRTIPSDDGSTTRDIVDGGVGGTGNVYHLANTYSGTPDYVFPYGNAGGRAYVGDWDGDGRDSVAYRIGNTFYIRDRTSAGPPTQVFSYGRAGDAVYVGDWDGDGVDTFAVRRGQTYHVKNTMLGGDADRVIHYGRPTDDVLVGDWDGNGRDSLAVRRGKTYHLKNAIRGGDADHVVHYGREGDDVYVGDWDADSRDTLMVRRDRTYFVKNAIRGGDADVVLKYGREEDTTLVGDWNGDGKDSLGIRR